MLLRQVLIGALTLVLASPSFAALIITLSPDGSGGTIMEWSGSGTDHGPLNVGQTINIDNIPGNPFDMSGTTASNPNNGMLTYTLNCAGVIPSDIRLFFQNGGASDDLQVNLGDGVFQRIGDTWAASGSTTLPNILFSTLNQGIYTMGTGDAANFGGVILRIVPIPGALVLFLSAIGGFAIFRSRRLRAAAT